MKQYISAVLFFLAFSTHGNEFETYIIEDNPNVTSRIEGFKVFSNGLPYALTSENWDDYEKQRHLLLYSCSDVNCKDIKKSKLVPFGNNFEPNIDNYILPRKAPIFENVSGFPVVFLEKRSKDLRKYFTLICKTADCSSYVVNEIAQKKKSDEGYYHFYADKNTLPTALVLGKKIQCKTQDCEKTKQSKFLSTIDDNDNFVSEYVSNNEVLVENFETNSSKFLSCKNGECSKYDSLNVNQNFYWYRCFDNDFALSKRSKQRQVSSYIRQDLMIKENSTNLNVEEIYACSQNQQKYYISVDMGNEDYSENRLIVCSDPGCNTIEKNIDTKPFGGIRFIQTDKSNHVWMANSGYSGILFLRF
ncbi:MAG: hypothetical protein R3E90_06195 [Marinicella sp.]